MQSGTAITNVASQWKKMTEAAKAAFVPPSGTNDVTIPFMDASDHASHLVTISTDFSSMRSKSELYLGSRACVD